MKSGERIKPRANFISLLSCRVWLEKLAQLGGIKSGVTEWYKK